jgi:hypothetical protein
MDRKDMLTVLLPYLTHCHNCTRAISAVAASSCPRVNTVNQSLCLVNATVSARTYHQEVDRNTAVTRNPSRAVRQGTIVPQDRIDQSTFLFSLVTSTTTYAEMFSLTPFSVILPGTLGSTRSCSVTLTSSRRIWYW